MQDYHSYRIRAIDAIKKRIGSKNKGNNVLSFDYKLDDLARELLDLPSRPKNDLPYVGWLKNSNTGILSTTKDELHISQEGINLIKRWEGFRSNAYLCPANVWTIGYGHTKTTKAGTCISHAEAEELLKQDLIGFENAVRQLVKVDLTQNQFDSLVSFTFNVGINAFGKSTLLRRLNAKQYSSAANEFERWVYANKNKLPGLVKRRIEEKNIFLS